MQKINENEINWINDGDDQDALTLNRPAKELLQKLGSTQSSDLVQQKGNSQDDVMSQKQVTDQLTGWGSQILPIQSGPDEMTNGIYRAAGLGFGASIDGQDGSLLVLGSETVNPGQSTGESNQIVFGNGNINVRFSDKADDDGKPVWSDFRKLTYTDEQVLLTGNQTIQGKKTFNTLPESSAGQVPTNDNQLTNKRYVDSSINQLIETRKLGLGMTGEVWNVVQNRQAKNYIQTNDKPYPIMVSGNIYQNWNRYQSCSIYVSGLRVASIQQSDVGDSSVGITAIVPAGQSWEIRRGGVTVY